MQPETKKLRHHLSSAIQSKDYRTLFMAGGCHVYALVLHEELRLPLFYSVSPDVHPASFQCPHAYVMKGRRMCFDYDGEKPIEIVAKDFAGWPDEPPRQTTVEFLKRVIKEKDLGEELERQMFEIARLEFVRRRNLYDLK